LNVGGLDGFGPVPFADDDDEPLFHADWEAHVLALAQLLVAKQVVGAHDLAEAIGRRAGGPAEDAGYDVWLDAVSDLLAARGVITLADAEG
jgi:nitrile hydratase